LNSRQIGFVLVFAGVLRVVGAQTADSARAIAPVTVKAKADVERTPANPHKFDLFLQRKAQGVGFFMTHEQIIARNSNHMQGLLQGLPGIKVRQVGTEWKLQSQRCGGGTLPGMRDNALDPLVFVDGQRITDLDILDDIRPGEIEALEVYHGASQLPAEARGRGCFAIFIWMRTVGK